jgi:hypothetical protein
MSEIVVHRTDGEGLPVRTRRGLVEPIDARVARLLGLALPADAGPVSEIGFDAQLGAMAAAGKAALASDLACYLRWCDDKRVAPLPADPEDLVRYIAMLEARGAKPAPFARRVASLFTAHGLSGLQERGHAPTSHVMVRAALKGLRRRRGAALRGHARSAHQGVYADRAARRLWRRPARLA